MNYGWNKTTKGFDKKKEKELLMRLSKELCLPISYNELGIGCWFSNNGSSPYLEQGDATSYGGVRLRRYTNLDEKEQHILVLEADKIYCEVMGLPHDKHDKELIKLKAK